MNNELIFHQQHHIGFITLNRQQALNALTLPMIVSLYQQLMTWQEDAAVHAVVIQASPGKAFCAGGDVRALYESRGSSHQLDFFKAEYRLNQLIHAYSKPYIALMDGLTMGGGVGISLHGSHPVASPAFSFAMPETSIGFFPDIGASFLLSKCPGFLGRYLGLTGNRLNAEEAHASGLVKYLMDASMFQALLHKLTETDLSSDAHAAVDATLADFSMPVNQAILLPLQQHIDPCFNRSSMEAIVNALASHQEDWHQGILHLLQQKSPLSLCVTLQQLLKASNLSFEACLEMDACLSKHFMKGHDFYEGVRALLIDKDKCPVWSPKTLEQVNSDLVNAYFLT